MLLSRIGMSNQWTDSLADAEYTLVALDIDVDVVDKKALAVLRKHLVYCFPSINFVPQRSPRILFV